MTAHFLGVTVCTFKLYDKKYLIVAKATKKAFQASFLAWKINKIYRHEIIVPEDNYFRMYNNTMVKNMPDLLKFAAKEGKTKAFVWNLKN